MKDREGVQHIDFFLIYAIINGLICGGGKEMKTKEIGDMATISISSHIMVQGEVVAVLAGGVVVLDQLDHNGNNHFGNPN